MTTYDYNCTNCGSNFEEFHGINGKRTVKCPDCGSSRTKRLISGGAGLIFKGSGFYITDYKNKNSSDNGRATTADKEKTSEKKEEKTGNAQKESKEKIKDTANK